MQDNITTIIGTLKAEAVGKCRERIDRASKKAKDLIRSRQYAPPAGKKIIDEESHGVTAVIKRRHGL